LIITNIIGLGGNLMIFSYERKTNVGKLYCAILSSWSWL
jgi:hypothetical protein